MDFYETWQEAFIMSSTKFVSGLLVSYHGYDGRPGLWVIFYFFSATSERILYFWGSTIQFLLEFLLNYFVWLRINDESSVPEMRIWSILLIKSDLKWLIHLVSRSLFSYLTGLDRKRMLSTQFYILYKSFFLSTKIAVLPLIGWQFRFLPCKQEWLRNFRISKCIKSTSFTEILLHGSIS